MLRKFAPALLAITLLIAVVVVLLPAEGDSGSFPRKPVTLLVAYAPGGAVDTIARLLARQLQAELGQRVVIRNRPGAGGQVGYMSLALASNDGYQLGFVTSPSIQMLTLLRADVPFALSDFAAIASIQADPVLLVVNSDSPYLSFKDLLAAAQQQPGNINVSGDGPLSNNQLQLVVLEQQMGIDFNFIPFNGSGPALTALLGKQVAAAVPSSSSAVNYIESGRLRALAVFSGERFPGLAGVPTMLEASGVDVPDIGMAVRGVVAPVGLPGDRMRILRQAFERAVNSPGFVEQARRSRLPLKYMNAAEFEHYLENTEQLLREYLPLLSDRSGG